jgi:hypothetical protein
MQEQTFTIPQAAKYCGLNYARLDRWLRHDRLLGDELATGSGRGNPRRLSWCDLVFLRCIAKLLDCGISYRSIRETIIEARTAFDLPDGSIPALVSVNGRVCIARDDREIVDMLRGGQLVLALGHSEDAVVELTNRLGATAVSRSGKRMTGGSANG